jgi:hypothetical protein
MRYFLIISSTTYTCNTREPEFPGVSSKIEDLDDTVKVGLGVTRCVVTIALSPKIIPSRLMVRNSLAKILAPS